MATDVGLTFNRISPSSGDEHFINGHGRVRLSRTRLILGTAAGQHIPLLVSLWGAITRVRSCRAGFPPRSSGGSVVLVDQPADGSPSVDPGSHVDGLAWVVYRRLDAALRHAHLRARISALVAAAAPPVSFDGPSWIAPAKPDQANAKLMIDVAQRLTPPTSSAQESRTRSSSR